MFTTSYTLFVICQGKKNKFGGLSEWAGLSSWKLWKLGWQLWYTGYSTKLDGPGWSFFNPGCWFWLKKKSIVLFSIDIQISVKDKIIGFSHCLSNPSSKQVERSPEIHMILIALPRSCCTTSIYDVEVVPSVNMAQMKPAKKNYFDFLCGIWTEHHD